MMNVSKRLTLKFAFLLLGPTCVSGCVILLLIGVYSFFPTFATMLSPGIIVVIGLSLFIICGLIAANSLSHRILEQLSLLLNVLVALNKGKPIHSPDTDHIYSELHPIFEQIKIHVAFSDYISKTLKEFLQNQTNVTLPLRSDYDEHIKAINLLMIRLQDIQQMTMTIAEGDLTIATDPKGENADIHPSIHAMINELHDLVSQARHYTNQIVRTGAQINSITTQGVKNSKLITKRINDISQSSHKMAGNIQRVAEQLQEQSFLLEDTSSSIEHTIHSVEEIAQNIPELKSLAEESASPNDVSERTSLSLDRMYGTTKAIEADANTCVSLSQEAARDTAEGKSVMAQAIASINRIQESMDEFFQIVRRLGDRAEEVSETLEVISDIADHTNLLAINAAIISAHAGEHGRDFAVIADEIGKFAERTRESTHEIEELLRTIRSEFQDAMLSMEKSSRAVSSGVQLSHKAGTTLEALALSILRTNEMVTRIARATAEQSRENDHIRNIMDELTQEQMSKQEQISRALWQLMQIIAQIRGITSEQAEGSARMAASTKNLDNIAREIGQAASHQVQTAGQIINSTDYIRRLVQRTVLGTEKSVQLTDELFTLGGNLAFTVGEYILSDKAASQVLTVDMPAIGFVKRGEDVFFKYMATGVQEEAERMGFQVLEVSSSYDVTTQIEDVNWLFKQPGLKGIIICPTDINVAQKLVRKGVEKGIPCVAADESLANAISIRSGNQEGGRRAAELFIGKLQPTEVVGVMVDPTVESMVRRAQGFRQQAEQSPFEVVEIYCDISDRERMATYITMALEDIPELQGLFLPNESTTTAYLNALHQGRFRSKHLLAVGFDYTPMTEKAIQDDELLGAIYQHPVEIGKQAFQHLHKLIADEIHLEDFDNPTIYIPTIKMTKETLQHKENAPIH